MLEKIDEWDGSGCRWIGFHLGQWAHHAARVDFVSGMWEAAAGALDMTTAELREALVDSTLEDVAEAAGIDHADVVAAALASAQADLDGAVEAGSITQEKADAIYERLENWLNEGGFGSWGDGPRRPFVHAPFFAPPIDAPSENPSSDDAGAENTAT